MKINAVTLSFLVCVAGCTTDVAQRPSAINPKQAAAPPQAATRAQDPCAGFFAVLDKDVGQKTWSLAAPDGQEGPITMNLEPIVAHADVATAMLGFSQLGMPTIDVTLTARGRTNLASFSAENIGKKLAIVIDNRLLSTPTIVSPIEGGQLQITGNFTLQEATRLASALKNPATDVK